MPINGAKPADANNTNWWLRSPYVSNTNNFGNVNSNGNTNNNNASNSYGVVPDFFLNLFVSTCI